MNNLISQPFRGEHGSLDKESTKPKKEEIKPKAAPKSIEQKRMEVAKKHTPSPKKEKPPGPGEWGTPKHVRRIRQGYDQAGELEKSIEWAADKFKWDPRTSDAASEAASSLANEMTGINVDKLKLVHTTKEQKNGVPDRIYFRDEDGWTWEVVREEDGGWDYFQSVSK